MSAQRTPAAWAWDSTSRKWYYYDGRTHENVYEDGRRVAQPSTAPRTTMMPPPSFRDYAGWQTPSLDEKRTRGNTSQASTAPRAAQAAETSRKTHSSRNVPEDTSAAFEQMALADPARPQVTSQPQPRSSVPAQRRPIKHIRDEASGVEMILQTEPPEQITDPGLLKKGIFARSLLLETDGEIEPLFENYRRRDIPRRYFVLGRVFSVLWAEPRGDTSSVVTGIEQGVSLGRFGERVFSKVRRFVVIREAENYCSVLAITTYGNQGVAKPGVKKREHSIIYSTRSAPSLQPSEKPARDEEPMQPEAIRVHADDPSDKLSGFSRLDYGRIYTIHHNLKVRNFGIVSPRSMDALRSQFASVWINADVNGPRPSLAPQVTAVAREQKEGLAGPSQGSARLSPHERISGHDERVRTENLAVDGDESESTDDDDVQSASQRRQASLDASAREALQRMVRRGFSSEEASAAIRRETSRKAPGQQDGRGKVDGKHRQDVSSQGRADRSERRTPNEPMYVQSEDEESDSESDQC